MTLAELEQYERDAEDLLQRSLAALADRARRGAATRSAHGALCEAKAMFRRAAAARRSRSGSSRPSSKRWAPR